MKRLKWYGVIFFITLVIVLLVRSFLIESYTISSSQMETALHRGDRVLVDKTAYGVRTPMTLLTIPFTFDSFLGLKSYSDAIQLDYNRLSPKNVKRSDIVLLNNPSEGEKPLDKRSLLLSRCVATPGDTIIMNGYDYFINGKKYIPSPDLLMSFRFSREKKDSIMSVLKLFNIPLRNTSSDSIWEYASLNRYEAFIVNQKLSPTSHLEADPDSDVSYNFLVPAKGLSIVLTKANIPLYAKIIEQENDDVSITESAILKNGVPLNSYEFTENYYWFVSDNPDESADSRSLGFISEKYVIGRVFFIWFSAGSDGIDWDRTLSSVK